MTSSDRYLSEVCELLIDSKLGYGDAAGRADSPRLKNLMANIGDSRLRMIATVANAIERTGRYVPQGGTFKGTLHRVWMALRDILSSTDDVNMLSECERGESYLIGKYDQSLNLPELPEDLRLLLSRQRAELIANLMEIHTVDLALVKA